LDVLWQSRPADIAAPVTKSNTTANTAICDFIWHILRVAGGFAPWNPRTLKGHKAKPPIHCAHCNSRRITHKENAQPKNGPPQVDGLHVEQQG
jgi:hypothetical protein